MKRLFVLLLTLLMATFLFGCYSRDDLDNAYDGGTAQGFEEGIERAEKAAQVVYPRYIEENGIMGRLEEGLIVLDDYLNGGGKYTHQDALEALEEINIAWANLEAALSDIYYGKVELDIDIYDY